MQLAGQQRQWREAAVVEQAPHEIETDVALQRGQVGQEPLQQRGRAAFGPGGRLVQRHAHPLQRIGRQIGEVTGQDAAATIEEPVGRAGAIGVWRELGQHDRGEAQDEAGGRERGLGRAEQSMHVRWLGGVGDFRTGPAGDQLREGEGRLDSKRHDAVSLGSGRICRDRFSLASTRAL